MLAMAAQFGIELDNCYLSDEFIKVMVNIDFLPMGTEDVLLALFDRGMSCLAFTFQSAAERILSKQTDQQRREHAPTYTETEAFRKSDPRNPPKTYNDILEMLTPYAMFLLSMFTIANLHCEKV
jgi:hypothetical protein